jgi:microcompartment protein CcmK/EutM
VVAVKIGRVAGTVVSTINSPVFDNRRLLQVDLLDLNGAPTGSYLIAVDAVDAGAGETVLVLDEGNSARQVLGAPDAPVRAVVVGIVDELVSDGRQIL